MKNKAKLIEVTIYKCPRCDTCHATMLDSYMCCSEQEVEGFQCSECAKPFIDQEEAEEHIRSAHA